MVSSHELPLHSMELNHKSNLANGISPADDYYIVWNHIFFRGAVPIILWNDSMKVYGNLVLHL